MKHQIETTNPGRSCIFCGCTNDRACRLEGGDSCAWLLTEPPVCTAPPCFRQLAKYWQQQIERRNPRASKKSREGRTLTGPLIAAIRSARQARLCLQRQLERSQPLWGSVLATDPGSR